MPLFTSSFVRSAAFAFLLLSNLSSAATSPNITAELGPSLSVGARIVFPGSAEFAVATDRDNEQDPPTFSVVVEVATETDVVPYANNKNISFLATTGLHGGTTTLGAVKQGINIRMRKLNSTTIAENGNTATFGVGIISEEVKSSLWAAGKITTTGACDCASSGHFKEQDTTSEWSLLSRARYYDAPAMNWAYSQFIFTHDKVAALYTLLNTWTANGTKEQPIGYINKNVWVRIPPVDANNGVIVFKIFYHGVAAVPNNYTAPLIALGPAVTNRCRNMMFPIGLKTYNVPALVSSTAAFNNLTSDSRFLNSAVLFESCGTQAVKAVADASTAFPHRADNIVITHVISYPVNSTLDKNAIAWGDNFRAALHKADGSSELHTYVNYAHGDETLQELYGYAPWRVTKLKALKSKYDPAGRFDFYAPI
ncbi:Uu.00g082970.m01.CDS01 [Anthostomella pinea]|uniref:Uu.00g082970.m01.CDS01 n=1 Tax=Anthostomella pinea TaxID=933095 RepID=A0AAI8YJF9_9PEZI|nr:Uu.00g082970.m01.CDS01 [Anthostomella pinea]